MLEVFALHQDQQSNFQSTLESHFLLISTKSTYATIGKFYQNITVFSWHPMRFWSAKTIFELVIDFRVPGTSLRTGKSGLIPSLYATPIESPPVAFSIYYVGTTSVSHHRGESLIIESLIMNHFLGKHNWKLPIQGSLSAENPLLLFIPSIIGKKILKFFHPLLSQKRRFR